MIQTWGIGLIESIRRARKIYNNIGSIPCPFFDNELVSFPKKQFGHIIRGKNSRMRPKSQQLIRLRLIEYVESIVRNNFKKITVEFRDAYEIERWVKRHREKVLEKKKAYSWGFITVINGSKVKAVIGQVEGGKKEFLSIMTNQFELHVADTVH